MKVLIIGDGLLGTELNKQTNWNIVSRKKDGFDITNEESYKLLNGYDTIINCVANTDSYSNDRDKHWNTNYKGVFSLAKYCNTNKIKLVHISTDFIYSGNRKQFPNEEDVPVHSEHWYSYTKLLADGLVQLVSNNYLICRCTHKPYPFPYKKVFDDRIGNFDYVNKISELIISLINKNASGVYNVGTEVKSMFDLVKRDNPNIEISKTPETLPTKTAMDISKLKKLLNNK